MSRTQTPPKILVVDDNPKNIQVIISMLHDANYEIGFAMHGKQALDLLNGSPDYDLVLLDIKMPVMDGFEVCNILKVDDRFKDIPVIFLSASHEIESIINAFEAGGVDYVMKPFNSKELLARVDTHLQLRQKTKEVQMIAQKLDALVKEKTSELLKTNKMLRNEIRDRKRAEKVLLYSQKQLRALTQRMDELSEKERTEIAHEIHDELGHLLTVLKFEMGGLINSSDISMESMKSELESLMSMVNSLMDTVRKIASELHPGILDHLGLIPAIEWQTNQFQKRTKILCNFDHNEIDFEFSKKETFIIFRIVQEILTNVIRHSKATKVDISLNKRDGHYLLKVSDNGIGFVFKNDYPQGSFGLLSMRERALSIGGDLHIESEPGKGTAITLSLKRM